MTYIQDKLDEIYKTRFPDNFTPTQMDIIENAFTDYHNHIIEKIKERYFDRYLDAEMNLNDILSLLQDTNPKE
jgi:hypothetical protein